MKVNHRLRSARVSRGWSQAKVAEKVGTDPVTVSRWERGLSFPYPHFREKLCELFEKTVEELGLIQKSSNAEQTLPDPDVRSISHTLYDAALPLPFTSTVGLIGRDLLIQQIKQRLYAEKGGACVALHGLPGVGKTALAIQFAHDADIRTHFFDGVLWVGLGPQPNILGQLGRWGAVLDITAPEVLPQSRLEAWAEAIHTAIGTRHMLLVIDDAWSIEAALAFKLGGPHCASIVTTRFPQLALQFAPDSPFVVHELNEEKSLELVMQWAPDVVAHEKQDIQQLIQLVGGLPLALTLMSKYLREQTYKQQPRRMHTAMQHLRNADARLKLTEVRGLVEYHPSLPQASHLSLQSVIMVSDQRLDASAQQALRALSVFPAKPNTFSEEAALAICAGTVEVLDVLSDAGLMENNGGGRYTLHQTIRDYAAIHLHETDVQKRLVYYFMHYIEANETDYTRLDMESSTIIAAFEVAYASKMFAEFVRMVYTFAQFWHVRGLYALAEGYLVRACTVAKNEADTQGHVHILRHLGYIHKQWGNYAQAEDYLSGGLVLARRLNNEILISRVLMDLGGMMNEQGRYEDAETYSTEGLMLARKVGDPGIQSSVLVNLGYLAGLRGNRVQEHMYYQEGLSLARQVGDPELISPLLMNLGVMACEQGDYTQAEVYLNEGLELVQQMGHRRRISFFLTNLGELEYERGNYAQAEAYLHEGLKIARQLGHREKIIGLLMPLGMVARERGDLTHAEEYLHEALMLARAIEHPEWISDVLRNLGSVALLRGLYEQAEEYLQEALTVAKQINYCALIAGALLNLGALALHREEYERAEAHLQEGLLIARRVDLVWLLGSLLFCLGGLYLKEGRIELAALTFNDMLIAAPKENRDLTPKALYGLARVAYAQGDVHTARMLGKKSCDTLEAIGHYLAPRIEQWLGTLPAS